MVMQARRSGFMALSGTVDGANFIKAHPFFRDIDRLNIHHYPAPSHPELRAPKIRGTLTLIFLRSPLTPVNGAPADATRDPLLHHEVHGAEIMDAWTDGPPPHIQHLRIHPRPRPCTSKSNPQPVEPKFSPPAPIPLVLVLIPIAPVPLILILIALHIPIHAAMPSSPRGPAPAQFFLYDVV
ncbi:hypothetical protein B0H14DRAFT_3908672 [Mycena olivaceomarginata]|nr:hypothetical protein B0H14DRAFT_3908672 [Mycena olivaceomarginata]